MQDQIEELEYIKNNMIDSSNSSLPSLETDENENDLAMSDRRKSLMFIYEAQRLANERRASLARAVTTDELTSKENDRRRIGLVRAATIDQSTPTPKKNRSDLHELHSFNFDQRSEVSSDRGNLDELNESPSHGQYFSCEDFSQRQDRLLLELAIPRSPPSYSHCSRTTMSLPFTYLNTREQIRFPNDTRPISTEVLAKKIIETNDVTTQTNSPTDRQLNLTEFQQETIHPKPLRPLLYSKGTPNRKIEFLKFQPLSTRTTTMTSIGDKPIQTKVIYQMRSLFEKE